jgi:hypothetical protein
MSKKRLCWRRWSKVSRYRKPMRTYFQDPGHRKMRLGRNRLRDVLCRRIALRTRNFRSGRLKKRLWWIRWSNVSRYRKTMRTHFCNLGIEKKRFGQIYLSVDLSRRITLITHNLPSWRLNLLKSMKGWFKLSIGHTNTFSPCWAPKKATLMNSLEWCIK